MNPVTNEPPLETLEKLRGLWARGTHDTCPSDHLTDCFNCIFPSSEQLMIRERFTLQSDIAGRTIISFAVAQVPAGPILLTLNSDGTFRDETHGGAILWTASTADDFAILNIFGRTYVTFKQNGRAYPDSPIFVYDGVTFRVTGWPAPTAALVPIIIDTGLVDVGYHSFAIAFESPSGYLSAPSPTAAIAVTVEGQNVRLTNIPVGPAGTKARWILATKANESELFKVPNGVIDNVAGTEFDFGLADVALIDSADYLRDIYGTVDDPLPGCAALKFYRGRMIMIGNYKAPDDILISRQQDPETVSLVENVVHLPVNYGVSTSVGGLVIRAVLYVTKPNATYSIQDNGGDPNTWGVDCVDSGIGAYDVGLSQFASDMSAQDVVDSSLVCNKRGLMYFTGQYIDVPLTYKIETIWQSINENLFHKVQIAHDVWRKRVYIACPLDPPASLGNIIAPATDNNLMLMMDYTEGMSAQTVKWSVWTGDNKPYKKIAVENFTLTDYGTTNMIYHLGTCNGSSKIWKIDKPDSFPPFPDDMGSGVKGPIWQWITTASVGGPQGLFTFKMLDLSVSGHGLMGIRIMPSHLGPQITARGFTLQSYANMDLQRLINLVGESIQVMLIADQTFPDGLNGAMTIDTIKIFGLQMYNMRPAYTERF